ncbi:cellulose synthase (UDP-forming) [Geodermatophilus dictyosporus]|uniref:Cellulose synthase (UDP-forming) n=1 Tax=Geodermatophilus dictyosporus TaxID=1523247 RepID=A0A1I5MV18_9ACTN|nr:glycosyltransferase [Geodermatophilus dictyosporus]SFP13378.1 cellulose synthase (UDP-forming) [Geodermatophilus dictyosporus]
MDLRPADVGAPAARRRPRPGGGLPEPESPARRRVLHVLGVAAVLSTAVYLLWRVGWTMPEGRALWIGVPFLLLELHGFVALVLFVVTTWDVSPARTRPGRAEDPDPTVTVLVATYNEPLEVLLPTVAAVLAMDGPHETWVLDDSDRPEVADMCLALGARYVTRPVHDHAKAGNLNAALAHVTTDLVAVFDADHVPEPDFLTRTKPYFTDPRLALVQTPQDFYNVESFEHFRHGTALHEESLFYRVIQAGKHNAGAAFWCGTNALLRVEALRSVGGVATETLTEDFHTTVRLHRAGWRTAYHNEVLASGLAAGTPDAFYAQRRRWGRGAMQVVRLRADNPVLGRGLTLAQRLSYLYSLSAWFDSWRTLGLAVLPVAVVVTGLFPVDAPPWLFLGLAGSSFLLQQVATTLLGRGFARLHWSLLFDVVRLPSNLAATLSLVRRGTGTFAVTAKGRTGDARARARVPAVLVVLLAVLVGGMVYAGLSLAGLTPTRYVLTGTAVVPVLWLGVTAGLVAAAVVRIRDDSYGTERREGHRFDVAVLALLDGLPGTVVDVSLGGARARLPEGSAVLPVGTETWLAMWVPDRRRPVITPVVVRSRQGTHHRLEFVGRDWPALAAIATTAMGVGALRWGTAREEQQWAPSTLAPA